VGCKEVDGSTIVKQNQYLWNSFNSLFASRQCTCRRWSSWRYRDLIRELGSITEAVSKSIKLSPSRVAALA
jgi:hypothetical protein